MKMSDFFKTDFIGLPPYWSDDKIRYVTNAIKSHDSLVELLDRFDRYQNMYADYLNSPFCADVRECLHENGVIQDDERPKLKSDELFDKQAERIKDLEEENKKLALGLSTAFGIVAKPNYSSSDKVKRIKKMAKVHFGIDLKTTLSKDD